MLAGMEGVGHISGKYGRFRDQPPRELAIARFAERQPNLIHLSQLQALGLSADAVRRRAAQGRPRGASRDLRCVFSYAGTGHFLPLSTNAGTSHTQMPGTASLSKRCGAATALSG
jgi:hypothetical protein